MSDGEETVHSSSCVETGVSRTLARLKTQHFKDGPELAWKKAGLHIPTERADMLYYALVFLLVAVVAGMLGFGFVAFAAAGIAKILFFIFLVLFLVSLISHLSRTSVP
jgi:uncharacterized membrane protein YtjA (UPF0391 family)